MYADVSGPLHKMLQVGKFDGRKGSEKKLAWTTVLHAANVLRATEIHTWGHSTATIRWHPPQDWATRLAVAHFKTGGPVYDDALSRLGDTRGPLLLMLPSGLAAALRQELDR